MCTCVWVGGGARFLSISTYDYIQPSWNNSAVLCRDSDADTRITSPDIIKLLNQPDFKILKWSAEDLAAYSAAARTVGSPVDDGKLLFTDLQKTYEQEPLVPFL